MASSTLDRFDEVLGGATNDELIELNYTLLEELAERAGSVTQLALNSGERDLVNEAAVYVATVDEMFPFLPKVSRVMEASRHVDRCKVQIRGAIEDRSAGESKFRWVGSSPAAKRAEQVAREREDRMAEELLSKLEISRAAVLDAFRAAATDRHNGVVQALDVALALCPDATATDTPGRQKVIARVGAEIRRMAAEGVVVKAAEAEGNRKTNRWALADAS